MATNAMRKKGWAAGLFLLTVVLVVTACSSGNQNRQEEANTPTATSESGGTKKAQMVSVFMESNQAWPFQENWPIWDWIEEETGIRVKADLAVGGRQEALNLAVASQTLADVAFGSTDINTLGRDGAFLNVAEHLDKLPNLVKFFEENPQLKEAVTMPGGEIYLVPRFGSQITDYRIWFNRQDIFEQHQLKQPTNWEELYEVSKQLKELYPDSYPLMFRHGLSTLAVMAPSFGTTNRVYRDLDTGEVRYGPTEDSFKTLVEWMNRFAEDELIPPDWLSMDYNAWLRYINNNQGFIAIQFIGQKEIVNNQGTAGYWEYLIPIAGSESKPYIPNHFSLSGFGINAQASNLEGALQLIDFMYSDEGMQLLSWGKEGVTYELVDGQKTFVDGIAQFTDLRVDYGIMTDGSFIRFDPDALLALVDEKEKDSYMLSEQYEDPAMHLPPNFTLEEEELLAQYLPNLQKHLDENISRFIIGSRPLSEWDQYVQEMQKLNLQEVVDIYERAWNRQSS
ncbi:hypothetical protein B1748_31870 [Paenibacillus sp. MY03]|uniref:extracellular solute-binding protein n=1 Tax=Paenibacillus sp. MY03 TaxID=302980 RepID=UPI000B3C6396|nr:extracellular solute-binding protein [Paenibacillus sp. MY03]OUS69216.1 hypothetical protein B1748_31870 [Paenibacillus sp. MY03]